MNSDPPQLTDTAVFKLTLIDPCNPPNSLTPPNLVDQVYTLTDPNAPSYTIGEFTLDPAYCENPITLEYSITALTSVEPGAPTSAITQTDKVFDFFYNFELKDLT